MDKTGPSHEPIADGERSGIWDGRGARGRCMRSEKSTVRRGVDLFQYSRVASYEGVGECRMAQGSEIEEGSSVALDGDRSSRGARRGWIFALDVLPTLRSLALGSRTAALWRAVARPFQRRVTALSGPVKGEVTASSTGATARFLRRMHGRLGARFGQRRRSRTFVSAIPLRGSLAETNVRACLAGTADRACVARHDMVLP